MEIDREKITAAMDLTAQLAVEQLASEFNKTTDEVLISFMESNTCRMLYDDKNKLWWDGPAVVAEEYKAEMQTMNVSEH